LAAGSVYKLWHGFTFMEFVEKKEFEALRRCNWVSWSSYYRACNFFNNVKYAKHQYHQTPIANKLDWHNGNHHCTLTGFSKCNVDATIIWWCHDKLYWSGAHDTIWGKGIDRALYMLEQSHCSMRSESAY